MDLNLILFPAPRSSYSIGRICGELVWIPKGCSEDEKCHSQRQITDPDFATARSGGSYNYRQNTQEKSIGKKFAHLPKPQKQDTPLDEISNTSTDSCKKPSKEKLTSNIKRISMKKALENFSDDDDEILKEHTFDHVPHKQLTERPMSELNDPDINMEFCNEGVRLNCLPDYYLRAPKTSNFHCNVLPSNLRNKESKSKFIKLNLLTDRPSTTANSFNHFEQSKESLVSNNESKFLFSRTNLLGKLNNSSQSNHLHGVTHRKNNPVVPRLKLKLETSQYDFDLNKIDENEENKPSLCTPRSVLEYPTKFLPKPVNQNVNLRLPIKNAAERNSRSGNLTERIHRENTPLTAQADCEELHNTTTRFITPKKANPLTSLLTTTAYQEALNRYYGGNGEIIPRSKDFAQNDLNAIALTARQQGSMTSRVEPSAFIPCMLLRCGAPSSKILVYFHGNGEDIHLARELLRHLRDTLKVHVLAVEYPGYGLYKGTATEQRILEDSESVYEYLITTVIVKPQDIIVFGRSIGSGPATYLASKRKVGALILMSAFTSIKALVKDVAGSWAQYLIKQRFDNLETIKRVSCPTFIVHGQKDRLIPFQHSKQLHEACQAPCELLLPKKMNHSAFEFEEDFTKPLKSFLDRCNFDLESREIKGKICFPRKFFEIPAPYQRRGTLISARA